MNPLFAERDTSTARRSDGSPNTRSRCRRQRADQPFRRACGARHPASGCHSVAARLPWSGCRLGQTRSVPTARIPGSSWPTTWWRCHSTTRRPTTGCPRRGLRARRRIGWWFQAGRGSVIGRIGTEVDPASC